MATPPKLVSLRGSGLRVWNYYWHFRHELKMSEDELREVGIEGDDLFIRPEVIGPLKEADAKFREHGYELIVKDAYRSPELYELAYRRRHAVYGQAATDRLYNMRDRPHMSGLVVDVNLVDPETGEQVKMRNPKHDDEGAQTIGFYKGKQDPVSREYERLQDLLIEVMLSVGFKLGVKREFWHFEYPVE
ncbi:MAG TPA: M15 family metallopeptidase [Patescibacteria group bacterium]|jgi:D-alanyl-D-alanine dipeptidase